eukprot:m.932583 g.932583  ORF g.932583 m.932583 type:complete len:1575 (+) comp23791_c0_seq1:275-4999(+)
MRVCIAKRKGESAHLVSLGIFRTALLLSGITSAHSICCELLAKPDSSQGPGWHNISRFLSGKYGQSRTGYTMAYGTMPTGPTVCASSKSAIRGCSGLVTWSEAKDFCEEQGARLCTQTELATDETHGSGCNYDYNQIWSSTSCESCSGSLSYLVDWGYSLAGGATAESPNDPVCRVASDKAYARCCATACNATRAMAEFNALAPDEIVNGGCNAISDTSGNWPATGVGSTARIPCPGTGGSIVRMCTASGWANNVDTSSCGAPTACGATGVCECRACTFANPCGAVVGVQIAAGDSEYFVDCAHKQLVVAPVGFPAHTTKIDLQGNAHLRTFSPSTFAGLSNVRSIYLQGLLHVASLPDGLFRPLSGLQVFDTADVPAVTSLRRGMFADLPNLKIFVMQFWNSLVQLPTARSSLAVFSSAHLSSVVIGNCRSLRVGTSTLTNPNGRLTALTLSGNGAMTSLRNGFFHNMPALTTIDISYNRALATLGRIPFAESPLLRTITLLENPQLRLFPTESLFVPRTTIPSATVDITVRSAAQRFTLEAHAFKAPWLATGKRIGTLTLEGYQFTSATQLAFCGAVIEALVIIGVDSASSAMEMVSTNTFKCLEGLTSFQWRLAKIAAIPTDMLASVQDTLEDIELRCIDVPVLPSDLFTAPETARLRKIRVTDMPRLTMIEPGVFSGLPNLVVIDLSRNVRLHRLDSNVFDGTFLTPPTSTAVSRRVVLDPSSLSYISRRAFNFDQTGIGNDVVIEIGTKVGGSALESCCGYHWLSIDSHFALSNLRCLDPASGTRKTLLNANASDCCVPSSVNTGISDLASLASNTDVTGFGQLTRPQAQMVNTLCECADWVIPAGQTSYVRVCAASEDTAPNQNLLQQTFDPLQGTCLEGGSACPVGTRRERDGMLKTLECEPWFHNSEPPYEIKHFLSTHVCFPCRVAYCAVCQKDATTCDTCDDGRYLLQTSVADTCEETCPLGYENSVDPAGVNVCLRSPSSSKLDSKTIAGISVSIVLLIAIGIVAFLRYRRKMKRKRTVDKFRVKTADEGKASAEAEKAKVQAELEAFKDEVGQNLREVETAWSLDRSYHCDSDSDGYLSVDEDSGEVAGSDVPMHWYWQEDDSRIDSHPDDMRKGLFVAYGVKTSTAIEKAYQAQNHQGECNIDIVSGKLHAQHTGSGYIISFDHSTQKNARSGFERKIARMTAPPRVAALHNLARLSNESTESAVLATKNLLPGPTTGSCASITVTKNVGKSLSEDMLLPGTTMDDGARLTCLPADLVEEGAEALSLTPGQVVDVVKRRTDGWFYGSVVYFSDSRGSAPLHRTASQNAKLQSDNGVGTSGWFPESLTRRASVAMIKEFHKSLGAVGRDDLAFPPTWEDVDESDDVARLYDVALDAEEVKHVVEKWYSTIRNTRLNGKIVGIKRIQNRSLWQSFAVKRIQIRKRDSDGRAHGQFDLIRPTCFHGCQPHVVPKIYQQGFNRSFCGRNMCRYGKGVYFARDASYSADPTYSARDDKGIQYMFVCRVLCGVYCVGRNDQLVPDTYDASTNRLYDSTVDNLADPMMWVTYHDAQAYPEYLLEFTTE